MARQRPRCDWSCGNVFVRVHCTRHLSVPIIYKYSSCLRPHAYEYKNVFTSWAFRCAVAILLSRAILCSKCGVSVVSDLNTSTVQCSLMSVYAWPMAQVQLEWGLPAPDFPTPPPYTYGGQLPTAAAGLQPTAAVQLRAAAASAAYPLQRLQPLSRSLQAASTVTWYCRPTRLSLSRV